MIGKSKKGMDGSGSSLLLAPLVSPSDASMDWLKCEESNLGRDA